MPFEDALLYEDDKQLGIILNFIAVALMFVPNCRLLAFAVMSNHFHFVVEGERPYCDVFVGKLTELLDNYYRYNGKSRLSGHIVFEAVPIDSLRMLRGEIIYTIRNPFVVRTDVNVFACPSTKMAFLVDKLGFWRVCPPIWRFWWTSWRFCQFVHGNAGFWWTGWLKTEEPGRNGVNRPLPGRLWRVRSWRCRGWWCRIPGCGNRGGRISRPCASCRPAGGP